MANIICDNIDEVFVENASLLLELTNLIDIKYIKAEGSIDDYIDHSHEHIYAKHVTKASSNKIFLGRLLPLQLERVLYLDCDTIIESSLDELFKINLEPFILGAVVDIDGISHSCRMNLPEGANYFNAGVLLINLARWREQKVEDKIIKYLLNPSVVLDYRDQDILNAVFCNKWKELDPIFNYQEFRKKAMHPNLKPCIIHYLDSPKPWHYMSEYPSRERYWHHLKRTPYRHYREPDRNLYNLLKKGIYRLFRATMQRNDQKNDISKYYEFKKDYMARFLDNDKKLFIWGTGSQGRLTCQKLIKEGYKVYGFIDRMPDKVGKKLFNIRIYGQEEALSNDLIKILICATPVKEKVVRFLKEKGLKDQEGYYIFM